MPLTKIEFAPGLVKDETPLAAEGGYVDADNMRFRQGKPETRGGWEMLSTTQFQGIARGMLAWSDLRGQPQLALGTANSASVLTGGALIDITPPYAEGTVLNPFSTTSDSPTVLVKITEHGFKVGQTVTFSNAAAVGGLTLNGAYPIATVETRDTFTVTANGNATATVAGGGGGVDYTASFPTGLQDGTGGIGYGTGTYGTGVYGLPNVTDFLPAVWSFANFGETLLLNRRGGPLYLWQPATSYSEIMRPGKYAGGTGWTTAATGGTKSSGTAANLSQNIQNAVQGGYVYRLVFTATVTAGTIKVQVNAGTPSPSVIDVGSASTPITQSGTYSRLVVMPANAVDLVFAADSLFSGTIANVSLKLEAKATQIAEAPRRIDSMFVDPYRIVHLLGTYEADGDYNPLLDRWSGQENYRVWIPDTNNLAGELAVSAGGRLVAGLASRGANLLWTDTGLFSQRFNGDGYDISHVATGCGLIGRHGAVEHNGLAYWIANDGNPYKTAFDFQGVAPQRIDCRIKSDIKSIAPSQAEKVFASVNSEFDEIQWFIPDARISTECNRAIVYHLSENHWTSWTEARSSWVQAGVFVSPVACGTDGYLYYQERGTTANGNPIPNFLETASFDIEDGGNLMQILGIYYEFKRPAAGIGPISFYVRSRTMAMGPETTSGPYDTKLTPAAGSNRDTKIDLRRTGRQMALRIQATTPWRLGVLRTIAQKSGAVR